MADRFVRANAEAIKEQVDLIQLLTEVASKNGNVFLLASAIEAVALHGILRWHCDERTKGLLTPAAYQRWVTFSPDKQEIQWRVCVRLPGMGTRTAHCFIWREGDRGIEDAALLIVDDWAW